MNYGFDDNKNKVDLDQLIEEYGPSGLDYDKIYPEGSVIVANEHRVSGPYGWVLVDSPDLHDAFGLKWCRLIGWGGVSGEYDLYGAAWIRCEDTTSCATYYYGALTFFRYPTDELDILEAYIQTSPGSIELYEDIENITGSEAPWSSYRSNIQYVEILDYVAPIQMLDWFYNCPNLQWIDGIHFIDLSILESAMSMFMGCSSLTKLDLSGFNTDVITNTSGMFAGCENLENIYVDDSWDMTNVTSSDNMFSQCTKLPNFNIAHVDKTKAYVGDGGYLTDISEITY